MATKRSLALPTAAALSGALRVPSTDPSLPKALLRLSRAALLSVVQEWLKVRNQATCGPVLGNDEMNSDSPYDMAQTLDELREIYSELQLRKGGKREIVDRILEGDWRSGLSLRQLAMLDVQNFLDHPTSQRWTARRLEKIVAAEENDDGYDSEDKERGYRTAELGVNDEVPRIRGPAFVEKLQRAIGSMVKAHYYLTRLDSLSTSLLRVQILDSPYNTQIALVMQGTLKASETLYVAFPDHSPYIYLSASSRPSAGANAALGLRKIVTDTLAEALSRPQKRYALKNSNLIARSLSAMVFLQGPGGASNALGGWSIFAAGSVEPSPLTPATGAEEKDDTVVADSKVRKRASPEAEEDPITMRLRKRRRQIAQKRFGRTGVAGDGRGIERVDVRLDNAFVPPSTRRVLGQKDRNLTHQRAESGKTVGATTRSEDDWRPRVNITLHGSHVFAGIRGLIETGAVDGFQMPGWMTGEHGVSAGVVRDGLMKRRKS